MTVSGKKWQQPMKIGIYKECNFKKNFPIVRFNFLRRLMQEVVYQLKIIANMLEHFF